MSEEQVITTTPSTITEAIASMPSGATRVLLQFNKISGAFTAVFGWVDPTTLNNDFFVYVEHEAFDFQNHEVRGTYPDFTVVERSQVELTVYESQLDLAAQQKITKQYPVINQVNAIGNAIEHLGRVVQNLLGDNPDPQLTAALLALDEMNDYIVEVKTANNLRKEFYAGSSDYIYITLADEAAAEEAQLEGGLHEAYGIGRWFA
ncbi:hypothetical protein D3C71_425430 [compost metagenome]